MNLLKVSLLFFVVIFSNSIIIGQKQGYFTFETKIIKNASTPFADVKVYLMEGSTEVESKSSEKNGKIFFNLFFNKEYTIIFKKEGYFSKSILINTTVPKSKSNRWFYLESTTELIPIVNELINNSFFNKPHAKISYSDIEKEFIANIEYANQITTEQNKLINTTDALIKSNETKYKELISSADNEFNNKNYSKSKSLYLEASKIKPKEIYPNQKIQDIEKIENEDLKYNDYITQGDKLLKEKKYNDAAKYFKLALTIFPYNDYPKKRIAEIEKLSALKSLSTPSSTPETTTPNIDTTDNNTIQPTTNIKDSINKQEKKLPVKSLATKMDSKEYEELKTKTEQISNLQALSYKASLVTSYNTISKEKEAEKIKTKQNVATANNFTNSVIITANTNLNTNNYTENLYLTTSNMKMVGKTYPILKKNVKETYFKKITSYIIILPTEEIVLIKYDYTFGSSYFFKYQNKIEEEDFNDILAQYFSTN